MSTDNQDTDAVTQTRIGVYLTEELATKIRRAAALESADKGTTVSMSRWMREAARMRLREEGEG